MTNPNRWRRGRGDEYDGVRGDGDALRVSVREGVGSAHCVDADERKGPDLDDDAYRWNGGAERERRDDCAVSGICCALICGAVSCRDRCLYSVSGNCGSSGFRHGNWTLRGVKGDGDDGDI